MSYDELQKIDVRLAERTIATVGPHRTPVSSILKKKQKTKNKKKNTIMAPWTILIIREIQSLVKEEVKIQF